MENFKRFSVNWLQLIIFAADQHLDQWQCVERQLQDRCKEGGVLSVYLYIPRQNHLPHRRNHGTPFTTDHAVTSWHMIIYMGTVSSFIKIFIQIQNFILFRYHFCGEIFKWLKIINKQINKIFLFYIKNKISRWHFKN